MILNNIDNQFNKVKQASTPLPPKYYKVYICFTMNSLRIKKNISKLTLLSICVRTFLGATESD